MHTCLSTNRISSNAQVLLAFLPRLFCQISRLSVFKSTWSIRDFAVGILDVRWHFQRKAWKRQSSDMLKEQLSAGRRHITSVHGNETIPKKEHNTRMFSFFFLKIEKKITVIFNQQTDSNWTNATWKNCQQISQHWCKPGKKPRHSSTHIDHHCFELSPHRNMFSIIDLAKDTILCLTSWLHTS